MKVISRNKLIIQLFFIPVFDYLDFIFVWNEWKFRCRIISPLSVVSNPQSCLKSKYFVKVIFPQLISVVTPTWKCKITQKKLTLEMDTIFSTFMTNAMIQWTDSKRICEYLQENWGQRRPLSQKMRFWLNEKILIK